MKGEWAITWKYQSSEYSFSFWHMSAVFIFKNPSCVRLSSKSSNYTMTEPMRPRGQLLSLQRARLPVLHICKRSRCCSWPRWLSVWNCPPEDWGSWGVISRWGRGWVCFKASCIVGANDPPVGWTLEMLMHGPERPWFWDMPVPAKTALCFLAWFNRASSYSFLL